MSAPTRPVAMIEPFGTNAVAGNITYPLPTPTQLPGNPGRASLNDGFPPANFLPTASGGIPVAGKDMQGILYWLSLYCVNLQAGQIPLYDAGYATGTSGGYAINAVLAKASGSGIGFWFNTVAGNTSNPDTGGAGWLNFTPESSAYLTATLAAGSTNNYAPSGFGTATGFMDIDPNAGASTITGLQAGGNGQLVTITNIDATNNLTIAGLNAGSSAANRFRITGSLVLTPNVGQSFRYSTALNLWIPV